MKCLCCSNTATDLHHIIRRGKKNKYGERMGGTDDPENLAPLCRECHFSIHHGTDSEKKDRIMKKCYSTIRDWSKVWEGKHKPKQVRENEKV